jgi:hypothetical protein
MSIHPDLARLAILIQAAPDAVADAVAADTLADWLYRNWYLASDQPLAARGAIPPMRGLEAALCEIVDSLSPWSDGWIVLATDADGACLAGKGEARRWAAAGRYAGCDRAGLPPMPGDRIALPEHLAWHDVESGQWAAQSSVPPEGPLVRVYVNVGPDAIGDAVHRIVEWLVDEDIAFRMKCPVGTDGFARADALVLYLERALWPSCERGVLAWAEELAPLLRSGRPALTQALAPGVGYAEDPGDGRSFGQHRCALLAEAVVNLPEQRGEIAAHLEQAIAAAGILADEPWRCRS